MQLAGQIQPNTAVLVVAQVLPDAIPHIAIDAQLKTIRLRDGATCGAVGVHGFLDGPLEACILRELDRCPNFSTMSCLIVGRIGTDASMRRLLRDLAGRDGGIDGGGSFYAQVIANDFVSGGGSVGYDGLTRADILMHSACFEGLVNISALTVGIDQRELNIVVGSHVSPPSIGFLRTSSRRMAIIQVGQVPQDALDAIDDLRALCSPYTLCKTALVGALRDMGPVEALRAFCRGAAGSEELREHLMCVVDAIANVPVIVAGPPIGAALTGRQAEVIDVVESALPPAAQGSSSYHLLFSNQRPEEPPGHEDAVVPPSTASAAIGRSSVTSIIPSAQVDSYAGADELLHPSRAESFETSTHSSLARVPSYIPPSPHRTEVVLASTGW